jgi:hypothetical protein
VRRERSSKGLGHVPSHPKGHFCNRGSDSSAGLADPQQMTRFITNCLVIGVPILAPRQRFRAPLTEKGPRVVSKAFECV